MGYSICGTTYSNGPVIYPFPSCKCVNIAFFDITPYYFRTGINCPFILVDDDNNWKEIVLKEIEEFGKPKNITSNPNEMDMFNFEADYNRTCLKKSGY